MRKLTLRNDFHLTEVTLNINLEEIKVGETFKLSPSQLKRSFRELCGMKDCCCGGVAGQRAKWHEIDGVEVQLEIMEGQRGYYNTPVPATVAIVEIWED
jgi:hypothetical protein